MNENHKINKCTFPINKASVLIILALICCTSINYLNIWTCLSQIIDFGDTPLSPIMIAMYAFIMSFIVIISPLFGYIQYNIANNKIIGIIMFAPPIIICLLVTYYRWELYSGLFTTTSSIVPKIIYTAVMLLSILLSVTLGIREKNQHIKQHTANH